MGIIATARSAFKASLVTFKATNPSRAQLRRFVAATVQAQYSTFVAGLPEPTIADQDDPTP